MWRCELSEENKAVVRKFVEEVQTKGNLGAIDEMMAVDFVNRSPMPGVPPTREGVKALMGMILAGIPDMKATIHDQIAEGDRVVTRKTLSGTHSGDLFGVTATGKQISIEIIDILRLE